MLQSRKKLLNECLFLAELKELLLDDIAKSTVKARNTVLNDYYNKICEKLAKPELSTYSKKDVLKVLNNWDYTANKRNI